MLNLQTVTEELGKECKGKAWVIVTSQQDIDSITKVKGNDFSKIQGRFDTRLSLSSANVDAVIKKRILDKTDVAAQSLRLLYEQKATIIKNLIMFNDCLLYTSPEAGIPGGSNRRIGRNVPGGSRAYRACGSADVVPGTG